MISLLVFIIYKEKISEIFPNLISLDISHNKILYVNKSIDSLKNLNKLKIANLFGNFLTN